ncbi:MAG: hypothetical protein WBC91_03940 [Phototrophicaceae bacterium]
MYLKFRGAIRFDTDEQLALGLAKVRKQLESDSTPFLTMEHIEALGSHVTVHHSGDAMAIQLEESRNILRMLADVGSSGYIDLSINDTETERYHAK